MQMGMIQRQPNWWMPKDCSMLFSMNRVGQVCAGFGTNSAEGQSRLFVLAASSFLTLIRFVPGCFLPHRAT